MFQLAGLITALEETETEDVEHTRLIKETYLDPFRVGFHVNFYAVPDV